MSGVAAAVLVLGTRINMEKLTYTCSPSPPQNYGGARADCLLALQRHFVYYQDGLASMLTDRVCLCREV